MSKRAIIGIVLASYFVIVGAKELFWPSTPVVESREVAPAITPPNPVVGSSSPDPVAEVETPIVTPATPKAELEAIARRTDAMYAKLDEALSANLDDASIGAFGRYLEGEVSALRDAASNITPLRNRAVISIGGYATSIWIERDPVKRSELRSYVETLRKERDAFLASLQ
jgi:hypothetical protein